METIKARMKVLANLYKQGKLTAKEYSDQFNSLWIEYTRRLNEH